MTIPVTQTAIYRILDANLDRAREGLRIIEEWCRFGLENADLAATCKDLRHSLAEWHRPEFKAARDTPGDPGTALSHARETQREGLDQLLAANLARVQEALRVLEEYSKLYDGEMASSLKQLRYRVYALESDLVSGQRLQRLKAAQLYLVTSPSPTLLPTVEAALQGGLRLVQYRDKQTDDALRYQNAIALRALCDRYGALFLVNDRVDLAIAANADGIHLGQQDLPIAVARQLLGPQRIIGRSTTNPEEMQRAIAEGADYIGVGPVYETPTKAGKAAAGHEYVRYARDHAPLPWFAIGGIDASNLAAVIAAGAQGVAVVRAIMAAEHPTAVTQQLVAQLQATSTALGSA